MKEQQRLDQMNEGAAFLRQLPDTLSADDRARLENIAKGMERFAALVLDRDAGPSRDLISECRRLQTELTLANGVAKELDEEYAAYRDKTKGIYHKNEALTDSVRSLEDQLQKAQASISQQPETPGEPLKEG